MEKNEEYTGVVERIGSNGEGILRRGEHVAFVPYALPSEKIKYRVLKVKKNVVFGKLVEVYTPTEERVRPKCSVYEKCGGCQLQHLSYGKQLVLKRKIVKDCLSKIAFLDVPVRQTVASDYEFAYRNKLQLPIRADDFGPVLGFFAQNTHRVVPIQDCPIQPDWCSRIIRDIKKYVNESGVSVYNEQYKIGLLKHLVVREADGKQLITLVINGDSLPKADLLISLLKKDFAQFSLFININKNHTNVIFGEKFKLLYGSAKISSSDMGVKYEVGPQSFMQVNDGVRRKIYHDAVRSAETDNETTVIDAYSGAGMMTAIFAARSRKAIGVEIVEEAVECANKLRELNSLEGKMENILASCADVLPEIMERAKRESKKTVLVLDPPRQGVEENIIEAVRKTLPDRIIYISCAPQTLSRDLGLLLGSLKREDGELKRQENWEADAPYEIVKIQPYDMFPQTKHVETLVVLSHKKPDGHIGVTVEFGEEDGQVSLTDIEKRAKERAPKKKTTYKDIQSYIEEKYGFKVHTAYIAEVKRDLGLPMYEAPNAVEELKKPRQHPTKEMVAAIKDALKHFEIIYI